MHALIPIILSRIVAGIIAGGAAAVPTIAQGEPAAVPASLEELIIQAIMAVSAAAIFYFRQRAKKKDPQ